MSNTLANFTYGRKCRTYHGCAEKNALLFARFILYIRYTLPAMCVQETLLRNSTYNGYDALCYER